jgi:hypothetical protein
VSLIAAFSRGPVSGVDTHQTDEFTASASQTAFTLTKTPVDSNDVRMRINGVDYDNGVDYTVSGTSVTWTDTAFVLDNGDDVEFDYDF